MSLTLQSTGFRRPAAAGAAAASIWLATGVSATLLTVLFFANRPGMFRLAVCGCAAAIGAALYIRKPLSYIQFTLWTWFLTPLLRRMIDLRFGFVDHNLVLLAPIMVTALSGMSLRELPSAKIRKVPFLLCTAAVLYGLVIGIMVNPSGEVIYGFFNWMGPPLFGLFLYLKWPSYPDLKRVIQRTVLWGTAMMAAYGVYQFCAPPTWDVYWWESLPYGLVAAFGRPYPYQVRVWSTLNAPAVFASVMGMSLLLVFASRSKLTFPFGLMGYVAFALTLSRTEWLGWMVGALYLALRATPIFFARTLAIVALAAALSAPLLSMGSGERVIQERIDSLRHLAQDDSVQTRFAMYQRLTGDLLLNPFGHGVSNADLYEGYSLDSGPLRLLYNFGILGTLFYLAGIVAALLLLLKKTKTPEDMFPIACAAVLISSIARLLSISAFMNVAGVVVWLCIGMGLAAQHFHAAAHEEGPA